MKFVLLRLFILAFLTLSLFMPGTVFSADEDKCPDCPKEKITLSDVFVQEFSGGAVTYTPTSTIINVDKYTKAGKVNKIEDVLQNAAGVDVLKSSGVPDSQSVVMMRGFDDSRFVLAIDGRPITGSSGKANTSIDWSSISLEDVEKIEIIRGGASAAYESAEGGVINVITKKGRKRDTLMPKLTYTQDFTMNFDYENPISHGEKITIDGGVGGLTYFLDYGHQEDDGYLKNNYFRGDNFSSNLNYLLPGDGLLSFGVRHTASERGNNVVNWPGIVGYDPDYPKVPENADTLRYRAISYDYPGLDNYKERRVTHLDLAFEQPIKDTTLKIWVYNTENYEKTYSVAKNGTPSVSGGAPEREKHLGGGISWTLNPFENNSLTLGYNYKQTGVDEMPEIYRINAGYFEDLWKLSDKWEIKTGLRISHNRQHTYPYQVESETTKTRH